MRHIHSKFFYNMSLVLTTNSTLVLRFINEFSKTLKFRYPVSLAQFCVDGRNKNMPSSAEKYTEDIKV